MGENFAIFIPQLWPVSYVAQLMRPDWAILFAIWLQTYTVLICGLLAKIYRFQRSLLIINILKNFVELRIDDPLLSIKLILLINVKPLLTYEKMFHYPFAFFRYFGNANTFRSCRSRWLLLVKGSCPFGCCIVQGWCYCRENVTILFILRVVEYVTIRWWLAPQTRVIFMHEEFGAVSCPLFNQKQILKRIIINIPRAQVAHGLDLPRDCNWHYLVITGCVEIHVFVLAYLHGVTHFRVGTSFSILSHDNAV
jgi:hypothetical protein